MSWGGAAFDLTIWALLWWPRTRRPAYLVAVGFHVVVWLLFPIGVFPWVMLCAATVFFAPGWPRRLPGWPPASPARPGAGLDPAPGRSRWALRLAAAWLLVQALVPMRGALYPGPVNWNEQGFRFAWRVMLIEKTGQIEYRVTDPQGRLIRRVYPRGELSRLQYRMLCVKPDMIADYAREIARRERARGRGEVRVYADAYVAYNGRPSQRWIDPERDLAATDPWSVADWILPLRER